MDPVFTAKQPSGLLLRQDHKVGADALAIDPYVQPCVMIPRNNTKQHIYTPV
jgi:hypothetical protein